MEGLYAEVCPKLCRCGTSTYCSGVIEDLDMLLDVLPLTVERLYITNGDMKIFPSCKFKMFSMIHTLGLSVNKMETVPQNMSDCMPSVRHINLNYNQIKTISRKQLVSYKNIEILQLNGNLLTEIKPDTFVNMIALKELWLRNNHIKILSENSFGRLSKLEIISLSYNEIYVIQNNVFPCLARVKLIYLQQNYINFVADKAFQNVTIRILNLQRNNITTFTKETFKNCSITKVINLKENPLQCNYVLMDILSTVAPLSLIYGNCFKCKQKQLLSDELTCLKKQNGSKTHHFMRNCTTNKKCKIHGSRSSLGMSTKVIVSSAVSATTSLLIIVIFVILACRRYRKRSDTLIITTTPILHRTIAENKLRTSSNLSNNSEGIDISVYSMPFNTVHKEVTFDTTDNLNEAEKDDEIVRYLVSGNEDHYNPRFNAIKERDKLKDKKINSHLNSIYESDE